MDHLPFCGNGTAFCIPFLDDWSEDGEYKGPNGDAKHRRFDEFRKKLEPLCESSWSDTGEKQQHLWTELLQSFGFLETAQALIMHTWIGLLKVVVGQQYVDTKDFIIQPEESKVAAFTTGHLESCLQAWVRRVRASSEAERFETNECCYREMRRAGKLLNSLSIFLDTFLDLLPMPGMEELTDQIAAIGAAHALSVLMFKALQAAIDLAFHTRSKKPQPDWLWATKGTFFKWMMERSGMCPYTVERLVDTSGIEELAFAYALGTIRTQQDHSNCRKNSCFANNINSDGKDFPRHIDGECRKCSTVSVPLEQIVAIIESGSVPTLRTQNNVDDVEKISLSAHSYTSTTRYLAISHVWADGLGSPTSNTVRRCQLSRIADRLDGLQDRFGGEELYFWMDTLCIPVGAPYKHLRNNQIQQMGNIYRRAQAVLVVDPDMLALKRDAKYEEIVMRSNMSAWASRLWTYQESSMNNTLLLMTDWGHIELDELVKDNVIKRAIQAFKLAEATNRLGHESKRAGDLQSNDTENNGTNDQHTLPLCSNIMAEKMTQLTSTALGRPQYSANLPLSKPSLNSQVSYIGALTMLKTFVGKAAPYNQIFEQAGLPQVVLDELGQRRAEGFAQQMLQSVQWRSSTRPDDEAIVLAAGLDLDAGGILEAEPSRKMQALLRSFPRIPGNLLFSIGPRIEDGGFRWAPRTVLRMKGGCVRGTVDDLIPWKGYEETEGGYGRPLSRLAPNAMGLFTFNAAVELKFWWPSDIIPRFIFSSHGYKIWPIDSPDEEDDSNFLESTRAMVDMLRHKKLVILLPMFNLHEPLQQGVLAELSSDIRGFGERAEEKDFPDVNKVTKVKYLTAVKLSRMNPEIKLVKEGQPVGPRVAMRHPETLQDMNARPAVLIQVGSSAPNVKSSEEPDRPDYSGGIKGENIASQDVDRPKVDGGHTPGKEEVNKELPPNMRPWTGAPIDDPESVWWTPRWWLID